MSADEHLSPAQFAEYYHGTSAEKARGIRESGLRSDYYERGNPVLTSHRGEAEDYARSHAFGDPDNPAVVTLHIPNENSGEYLHDSGGTAHDFRGDARALRKALPPEYVHKVDEI
jgi:hypothetical protein